MSGIAETVARVRYLLDGDGLPPLHYDPLSQVVADAKDLRTLLAAVDTLTRERDVHESLAEKYAKESGKMEAQRDIANARADRYRAALVKYGQHADDCDGVLLPCTCGLDAATEAE